jgi:tetratricopeptide (TPR) repeat protein
VAKKKASSKRSPSHDDARRLFGEFAQLLSQFSPGDLEKMIAGGSFASWPQTKSRGRNKSRAARDPEAYAQQLVDEAHDAPSDDEAVELAKQALQHDPQCVEAHLLLGDLALTAADACEAYRAATQAAEAKLGPEMFEQCRGRFWDHPETRPYMEARRSLAENLWAAGKRDEAVRHYEGLLELNPNDNQGNRYALTMCYLETKRPDAMQKLLAAYPDDDAPEFTYGSALLQFRTSGDSNEARAALRAAFAANRHVPDFLLGEKRLPAEPPTSIQPGRPDEAASYVFHARNAWVSTPEALAWLRQSLADVRKSRPPKRAAKLRLSATQKKKLLAAPPTNEVWQVGPMTLPAGAVPDGELLAVAAHDAPLPLFLAPYGDDRRRDVWDALCGSILEPADQNPRRPACVEVEAEFVDALRESLQHVGIEVRGCDNLDSVARCGEQILSATGGKLLQSTAEVRAPDPAELIALPASDDVWQVDLRALPIWTEHEGRLIRPWSVIVLDSAGHGVLGQSFDTDRPTLEKFWAVVAEAMPRPLMGEPCRPAKLNLTSDEWAGFLRSRCEPLGIAVETVDELPQVDAYSAGLMERNLASAETASHALTSIPGLTFAALAGFYEAAASFYRAAPWRHTAVDAVRRIARLDEPRAIWYAVVMGQSGLEMGLALYERLEDIRAMYSSQRPPDKLLRRMSCLSLMYTEPQGVPFADLDAVEKHAWSIAAPEAYPVVIRLRDSGKPGLPNADELSFLEGAVRALHAVGFGNEQRTCEVEVAGGAARFEVAPAKL